MTDKPAFCQTPIVASLLLLTTLAACTDTKTQTEQTSTTQTQSTTVTEPASTERPAAPSDTTCYRYAFNRDTFSLTLYQNGINANGFIELKPYQKDRATGSFTGKVLADNTIQADWKRAGEGVTDTYRLDLTLSGDTISWPEGERTQKDGKWLLNQTPTADTYRYKLGKIGCR